jgi:epoxyqueuosine reductase
MSEWVFGCDVCQEVCPWNRKAPAGNAATLQARPDLASLDLFEIFGMSEDAFRRRFRDTALWRARRRGLLRNAALILGNRGDVSALPVLEPALADPDEVVREAVQWAVERIRAAIRLQSPTPHSRTKAS